MGAHALARDAAGGVTGVEEDEGRQLALFQACGPRVEDSGLGHITEYPGRRRTRI
jgi:hypothetical protein